MEEQNLGFVAGIDHSGFDKDAKHIQDSVEQVAKKVEQSGMSVDEFAKRMQGVLSSFDRLTQAVDKNTAAQEKAMSAGKKAADAEKQGADKATDAIDKTGKATDELGRKLKKTGDDGAEGFGKLQKAAAGFFTLAAAKEFGQKVFEVRSEIQSLQTSFDVLVGNKQQAEELFNSIKDFATHTPMQMKDLASAAQTMMSFNIPVEQIMDNLKALGDVSMGDAQKFQSLSLAFSQMSATGKLMGQDLLQMINAGFNPLATISEKTGKSISELKDEMSKGAISADMVRQAFMDATSEGGKFAGMLEKQSQTLGGAYSNLQGAINDMFNAIGEQTEGIMAGAINAATVLVQNYEMVGRVIMQLVSTYGTYKAAVMVATVAEKVEIATKGGATVATLLYEKAQKLLNATMLSNPYVLAATAIGALVSAMVIGIRHTDMLAEGQKRLNDAYAEAEGAAAKEQRQIDDLFGTLKKAKEGTDKWKSAKEAILSQYGGYLKRLGSEVSSLKDVEGAYRAVSRAARDAAMARGMEAAMGNINKDYGDTYSKNFDKIRESLKSRYGEDYASKQMNLLRIHMQRNGGLVSDKNKETLKGVMRGTSDFGNMDAWVTALNNAEKNRQQLVKETQEKFGKLNAQLFDAVENPKETDKKTDPKASAASAKAAKEEEKQAKEAADRAARQVQLDRELAEKEIEARRAAENALAEAAIAGIEDESERERAQEELEHKKRLADIERKGEELKKARYEANKKQWELNNKDKHYETDSEEGRKGWQGVSLSADESAQIKAELAKENAEYERSARERAQNLIAAHQSYTDRKIQLDKEYANTVKQIDEEIAAANARGDQESVEALNRTKQQAATDHAKQQSALSLDILKESPEYIRAFEDLQQTSSETLEYLIEEFEKVKDSAAQSLDPKDLKEYTDIIQRMNDELGSRNPFKAMRDASIEAKKAHEEVVTAEKEVEDAEKQLAQVREKGSHWVVTVDKSTGKLVTTYMTEEKAQEKVTKAKKKLTTATDKERKATEKHRKAEKKALDAVEELCDAVSNLGGIIGGSAGEIVSLIGEVGSFAVNVINTVNKVIDNVEAVAQGASAAIKAVESASVILAVIGAALQIMQKLTSMFGANYDEYNELVGQYEALVDVWDELIDKKQEYIKISYGAEVTKVGKEVIALLEEETKAWRKLGRERLNAGASAGSHSIGVRSRENMDNDDWIAVAKSLGRSTGDYAGLGGRLEGLFDLSVEQLTKLREDAPAFWAKLDDDVKKYLNDIIDGAERIAEQEALMKERITGLSFDTAFDDLMDYMYEVADGSEDVMNDIAENWQQMINRMVVNNLIGNKMRERLEEWYNSIAEMQEAKSKELSDLESAREKGWITDYSYNISLDDINKRYEAGIEKQKEAYNDIVNSGKQQIEEFTELGLIKPVEDAAAELKVYFEDLKDSWIETLTDMTATTEDWKNELIDQVLSDLVESTILNAPLAVMVDGAEKQFDDFKKYLEDWTGRYKAIIEDQTLTDEERTAKLKTMIQEQTDVREKQAAKSRSLAEGIGKDMKEAFSNSLDNLGDTLLDALLNTEKDAESMGREIASTLIKEMLQTMLASEKYSGEIAKIKEKWQQVLTGKNTDEEGNILFTMDDVLQQVSDLNDTIANDEAIKSLAGQYQELNKQIKNTDSLFGSIKDTFASSMMDLNKTADEMASDIGQTIAKNIIEQMVVSSAVKPLVDNLQKAFDAANVEGATYSSVIGDEAVQNALAELKKAFPELQETAKGIMTGLGVKMNETAKQGFSDLKGTFVNTLTDMDADAETLGKNLGKSMMEQMLNAMVEKEYKDDLKRINDEWADALEAGDPARLEAIKQKAEDLFATIEADQSIKKLADEIKALTDDTTASPFDNLRSSFLSALTDMSKSTADFTKDISTMIAQSFVDSFVMGDLFDEKLAKWKKKYKEITTDSSLSEEQRMKQLKGLSELIAGERDAMKDEVNDIYKMLGIREGQDQSATMNMAEAATYDQFELYLGMETSHLMVAEETKGLVAQVLSTLQGMSSLTNPSQNYGEQIFMRLGTTNEYLLAVKKAVEGIHSEFGMKIDRMNAQLAKWG